MLTSMTGYGRGVVETDAFLITIEIRSVNSKFLKIAARLGDEVSFLQPDVDEMVRKRLVRGSVSYDVTVEPAKIADLYGVNKAVLKKYFDELNAAARELGTAEDDLPSPKDCLTLPGVVQADETIRVGRDEILPHVAKATEMALEQLVAMRKREGTFLGRDLAERCEALEKLLDVIRKEVPAMLAAHAKRLRERVQQLLADADVSVSDADLVREVAIVAERSDIAEELTRMSSHLEQFRDLLAGANPVGRRLEFVVQEMFRESNTMGAKSLGGDVSRHVVELKAEVDRLKEQVLNVE